MMKAYQGKHRIWLKTIVMAVVCLFLCQSLSLDLLQERAKVSANTLAPELRINRQEFKDAYQLGYRLLAHRAINKFVGDYIRETLNLRAGQIGILTQLPQYKTESVEIAPNGEKRTINIPVVGIPGLLKNTGQFGHVGLGKWNNIPVKYIDSSYFDIETDASRHETQEIAKWEAKRLELEKELGRTIPYEKYRETLNELGIGRELRDEFHRSSVGLAALYAKAEAKALVDVDKVYDLYQDKEYGGLDRYDKDFNIAAAAKKTGSFSISRISPTYKEEISKTHGALPPVLKRLRHALSWPIDMGNDNYISQYMYEGRMMKKGLASWYEHPHQGIDIMAKPGTPVRSALKGRIICVRMDSKNIHVEDGWPEMAQVWVYNDETGLLLNYQHLSTVSLSAKIKARGAGYDTESQIFLEEGEIIGEVGNWYFDIGSKGSKLRDSSPEWVRKMYEGKAHHLHFGATYIANIEDIRWSLVDIAKDGVAIWLNPLQLLKRLDEGSNARAGANLKKGGSPADYLVGVGENPQLRTLHTIAEYKEAVKPSVSDSTIRRGRKALEERGYLRKGEYRKIKGYEYTLIDEGKARFEVISSVKQNAGNAVYGFVDSSFKLSDAMENGDKVLFAMDEELGREGTERLVRQLIRDICGMKDSEVIEKKLRNIIFLKGRGKALADDVTLYTGDGKGGVRIKKENVIMITKSANEANCGAFKDGATITFVDDSKIDSMDYYPFMEVALFTLAKALYNMGVTGYGRERLVSIYKSLTIEQVADDQIIPLFIDNKVVKITLRPITPLNYDELQHIYRTLRELLQAT